VILLKIKSTNISNGCQKTGVIILEGENSLDGRVIMLFGEWAHYFLVYRYDNRCWKVLRLRSTELKESFLDSNCCQRCLLDLIRFITNNYSLFIINIIFRVSIRNPEQILLTSICAISSILNISLSVSVVLRYKRL